MLRLPIHHCHLLWQIFNWLTGIFSGLQLLMPRFFNKSSVCCSWSVFISPGFLSILVPRKHLSSPFSSFSKFCLIFFLVFICSKSELAAILSSTHTRTCIKLLPSRLAERQSSLLLCWKLSSRKVLKRSYQFLMVWFKPYIGLLKLHTSLVPSATFSKTPVCSWTLL